MPIPKGDGVFKVPMPNIETPRFKFGSQQQGGMGQGDGEKGDPVDGEESEAVKKRRVTKKAIRNLM